jgi:hypothetical protein
MRSQLRSLATCAALGASALHACLARADDRPDRDPSRPGSAAQDKVTAADLRARADKAFNEGDFRAALAHNLAAYRLTGDGATACNAGLLARKIAADGPPDAHNERDEHLELAAELLERCAAQLPADTADQRKSAAPYFRALELTRVELGAVRVIATDPSAEVSIGGRSLGHGPIDVTAYLREGQHEVMATRGARTERRRVQVQKRGAYTVRLEALPLVEPKGKAQEHAAPPPLAPRRVAPLPAPPPPPNSLVILGSVTSGGAAVAAGVLFGVSGVRQAEADEARQSAEDKTGMECFQSYRAPSPCRAYRQEAGAAQSLMTAGFVSLGGAVLTGAATLVYGLATKRDPKATAIAPRGLGMVVQWR